MADADTWADLTQDWTDQDAALYSPVGETKVGSNVPTAALLLACPVPSAQLIPAPEGFMALFHGKAK
jgi:hypothetical protein